jgi:hypothetical protein
LNKRQKEVLQAQLNAEKAVLKELEKQYKRALHDIGERVKLFDFDLNRLDTAISEEGLDDAAKAVLQSQRRSRVYQKQYQEALRGQISGILDKLHGDEYSTIQQYLDDSYTSGFVGTMYDIAGQGIPLIMPIDQAAAVRAVQLESKVKEGFYNALGVDINGLKKTIKQEVSRGIATGMNYSDIARNINNVSKTGLSNAKRIARTESHRIQQASTLDAQNAAKSKGADVVKQWDSTLDGKTRSTHRQLDGQIREIDEDFEIGGMKAKAPGYFGRAAEDINCRCVSLTRARWALDDDELATLKERAAYFGLDKTKDFGDFKEKYLKTIDKDKEIGIIKSFNVGKSVGASAKNYPVKMPESKQHVKLAEGQKVEGMAFAGKGTDKEIRDRFRLESTHGHPASEWQKVSGKGFVIVDGKKKKAELHWYEAEGEIVEMKVKRFYDDEG